jgi:hypothetical protein
VKRPSDSTRFRPGDHLQVWRRFYYHHGVYLGDDRVVQFGGRVSDKPHARIDEVELAAFEQSGIAQVVEHGRHSWPGIWDLPPADPPERIVDRARWLVDHHPDGAYNVFGRNCESIANWCVAGYGESHQWRRAQGVNALFGAGFSLWVAHQIRRGTLTPRRRRFVSVIGVFRLVPLLMYYRHNKRFYDDLRRMGA